MAWIESHTILTRHRKVLLLAYDLKISVVQTIGHLHAFWHTILEQQEDGDLSEWPDALIEEAALWEGTPGVFITLLRERGWVDGHLVHDWIDYVGPYLTKKYCTGNQARLKDIWLKHGYKYGKGNGKNHKQQVSRKRVEREKKFTSPLPSLPNPSSPLPSLPNQTKPKEEEKIKSCDEGKPVATPKSAETWEVYSKAYLARYGVSPVRNKKTNALLCQLVDRLGVHDAPAVAEFYLSHNSSLYVRCRHPPNLLVMDAEGLWTQWATGVKATISELRQAEMKDDAKEQVKRVEAMLARGL